MWAEVSWAEVSPIQSGKKYMYYSLVRSFFIAIWAEVSWEEVSSLQSGKKYMYYSLVRSFLILMWAEISWEDTSFGKKDPWEDNAGYHADRVLIFRKPGRTQG